MTFETFRDNMLAAGYEEVLERRWAPHAAAPTHPHPFEGNALGVHGEMRLSEQGGTARQAGCRRLVCARFNGREGHSHEIRTSEPFPLTALRGHERAA